MAASALVIPKYYELFWPTLQALQRLGGSGTVQEIEAQVYEIGRYSEEQRGVLRGAGPATELAYRLAWARTYLKHADAVANSQRGVWSITDRGSSLTEADMARIPAQVRAQIRATPGQYSDGSPGPATDDRPPGYSSSDPASENWQEQLLQVLLGLEPAAFERLAQRLLREQGFVSVTVTGRTGDGGIDGTGILRMKLLTS